MSRKDQENRRCLDTTLLEKMALRQSMSFCWRQETDF